MSFIFLIIVLVIAHNEFNKKNNNFISFKDAIFIGLIILGISFIFLTLYNFLSYEFIMKEEIQQRYSDMYSKYGIEVNYIRVFLVSLLHSLFLQILLMFVVITVESQWKIYKKAGKDGWASIIPIYNIIVLLEIVKKPAWWFFLLLIPFVNIIFVIWINNLLSKKFGKDEGFTIGLIFLPFIFYPLLGMSRVEYIDKD